MTESIGPMLRQQWRKTQLWWGGKWLFSKLLGQMVPYTGSIAAVIQQLEPGYCMTTLTDRRRVRNHLRCIHAIALANLGEMTTGLALLNSLPDKTRGILAGLSIEYMKKARGKLTAECHCEIPANNSEQEYELVGKIRNADNEIVAIVYARWLIGPEKQ